MKPAKIVYERKYNLGDYSSELLQVEYNFDQEDTISVGEAFDKAMKEVHLASTTYKHRNLLSGKGTNVLNGQRISDTEELPRRNQEKSKEILNLVNKPKE